MSFLMTIVYSQNKDPIKKTRLTVAKSNFEGKWQLEQNYLFQLF